MTAEEKLKKYQGALTREDRLEKILREILKFMEQHQDSSSLCWNMADKIRRGLEE